MMLAFLTTNVMAAAKEAGMKADALARLSESTLAEWAAVWAGKQPQPDVFVEVQSLPQSAQSKIAAGFELIAAKP
jgi:hypothetical protein